MMIILSLDAILFVVYSFFFVSSPHPTDFVTLHMKPQHSASQFSDLQFGNQNRFSLHASWSSDGHLLMSPSSVSSAQQRHCHRHQHHLSSSSTTMMTTTTKTPSDSDPKEPSGFPQLPTQSCQAKGSEKRCHEVPTSNSLGVASTQRQQTGVPGRDLEKAPQHHLKTRHVSSSVSIYKPKSWNRSGRSQMGLQTLSSFVLQHPRHCLLGTSVGSAENSIRPMCGNITRQR